jgi:hypothetical protein
MHPKKSESKIQNSISNPKINFQKSESKKRSKKHSKIRPIPSVLQKKSLKRYFEFEF